MIPTLAIIRLTICVAFVLALSPSMTAQRVEPKAVFNPMSAEELKSKLERNEPLTIIDVRSAGTYASSDNKIRGAIHVKLRKLRYRLGFAPLKDVPRDREIVTYCACPGDESSNRAAQILSEAGFQRVRVLKGGWQAWLAVRGQVEPRPRG
jgi:rhodanese-related sulfurtransferase